MGKTSQLHGSMPARGPAAEWITLCGVQEIRGQRQAMDSLMLDAGKDTERLQEDLAVTRRRRQI